MRFLDMAEEAVLGVEPYDPEHMREIAMVNLLHASIKAGLPEAKIRKLVEGLLHQTQIRFAKQHNLMRRIEYPTMHQHRLEHHEIMRTLTKMWSEANLKRSDAPEIARRIMADGASLMQRHMANEDRLLRDFLPAAARTPREAAPEPSPQVLPFRRALWAEFGRPDTPVQHGIQDS